jgi:hypothetical protein
LRATPILVMKVPKTINQSSFAEANIRMMSPHFSVGKAWENNATILFSLLSSILLRISLFVAVSSQIVVTSSWGSNHLKVVVPRLSSSTGYCCVLEKELSALADRVEGVLGSHLR